MPTGANDWTVCRLQNAVKSFVGQGPPRPGLLSSVKGGPAADRLLVVLSGVRPANPDLTLEDICCRLEALREPSPRGRSQWHPSTVRALLKRAEGRGLLQASE